VDEGTGHRQRILFMGVKEANSELAAAVWVALLVAFVRSIRVEFMVNLVCSEAIRCDGGERVYFCYSVILLFCYSVILWEEFSLVLPPFCLFLSRHLR